MSGSIHSEITDNVVANAAFLSQKTNSTNLITMYPRDQTAKLTGPAITETILKKWGKDGYRARANAITNSKNIKGILFLTKDGHIRALYLPQIVYSEDGTSCIVGTMSNHADNPKIRIIPIDALKSCVIVTQKSSAPLGTTWGPIPVDVTHEKLAPFFPPESVTAGVELYVGKVAAAMPIPLNVENITVGDLNDQDVEATPTSIHEEWGANWAFCMTEYDPGLADVFLKEEDLRQYLPATLAAEWADPTNTIYSRQDSHNEDIDTAEDKILDICRGITDNDKDGNSTIGGSVAVPDAAGAMVNAMQRFNLKVDELSSNVKPAQLQATKNRMMGTNLLMYAHLAKGPDGEDALVLPEPSECLTNIFENATSAREMSKLFASGLKTTERAMGASDHFILKGSNMPKIQPALLGFMAVGNYHGGPITSLSDTNLTGLAPTCLIPDNKDSTKKKTVNETAARAEEAMGEFDEKRTKTDTSITVVGKLTRLVDLTQTLANELLVIMTKVKVDVSKMRKINEVPLPVYAIATISGLLTSKKAKDFFSEHDGEIKGAAVCMAVLYRYSSMMTDLAEALCNDQDIATASERSTDDINLDPWNEARADLESLEREIKVLLRGSEIAKSPFFENSDTKATYERNKLLKMKAELALAKPNSVTPPNSNKTKRKSETTDTSEAGSKRQKTHNDAENLGKDGKDGYIIKLGTAEKPGFSLPKELDMRGPNNFALCKNIYMKGRTCRFGKACLNCHKPPNQLPGDKKQIIWDFMASDKAKEQGLVWNSVYVDAKVMSEAGVNTKGSTD